MGEFEDYARIYNAIGCTYLEMEMYFDAVKWFEKGIRVNDKYHSLYYGQAIAYNKMGKPDQAIKTSQTLLDLNPNHPEPYASLGDAYLFKQDYV